MQDAYYDEYTEEGAPKGLKKALFLYVRWGGALLSLVVLGLMVLWAYRLGVRDAQDIPVIQAMEIPARVLPEDPGGEEIAHQGLEVNEILAGSEAQRPGGASLAPEAMALDSADDPVIDEPEQVAAEQDDADPLAETILSLITAENSEPAPGQEDVLGESDLSGDQPRPRVRPETLGIAAAGGQITQPPQESLGAALSATAVDPDELAAGTRLVQLGAFDTTEVAEAHWARLLGAHSDLLGSKSHYVQRSENNGRVYYRLRAVGFDSATSQRALCEALVARNVDCIPVTVR